jgi:hypothetical protein
MPNHVRVPRENRLDASAHISDSFASDNSNFVDSFLTAGLEVIGNQLPEVLRTEAVQVKFASDRHWHRFTWLPARLQWTRQARASGVTLIPIISILHDYHSLSDNCQK